MYLPAGGAIVVNISARNWFGGAAVDIRRVGVETADFYSIVIYDSKYKVVDISEIKSAYDFPLILDISHDKTCGDYNLDF